MEYQEILPVLSGQLENLTQLVPLAEAIESFWQVPEYQKSLIWKEHIDINSVMLATSLAPEGFLTIV